MLPPMMPFLHDAFWFGLFAGLALFAWKAAERYDLRLSSLDWRRPPRDRAAAPATWFTATTARSSGNSAFDDWRDGELARIEVRRRALETRLRAFERFVETLKRAQDRATFDRFMAEAPEMTEGAPIDPIDHRPASPQS